MNRVRSSSDPLVGAGWVDCAAEALSGVIMRCVRMNARDILPFCIAGTALRTGVLAFMAFWRLRCASRMAQPAVMADGIGYNKKLLAVVMFISAFPVFGPVFQPGVQGPRRGSVSSRA